MKEKKYKKDLLEAVKQDVVIAQKDIIALEEKIGLSIKEIKENLTSGYVVTIDDMTSLILAEKHGAWSDIAKKIAHEVKNPLTPIKLSAERIEKKSKDKSINYEDIKNLTQTISKQVDDIGKLVDEFSSFARMPEPEIKLDNLN